MKLFIFILLFVNAIGLSQAEDDPCLKNFNTQECNRHISKAMFFFTGNPNEKTVMSADNKKYLKVIQTYYDKYGFEGFIHDNSGYSKTLFEEVFESNRTGLDFLKHKILADWKKGTLIRGQNIFQVFLTNPIKTESSLNKTIFQVEALFPSEGNNNLELTEQKFGLPWDDKDFLEGYVERLKSIIADIDRTNEFFKRNDFPLQREQLLKIIERLGPLSKIHTKICEAKTQQEIDEAKLKLPGIFKSEHKDVISCLLKNNQCGLVENLIKSGEYPVSKLKSYFNEIYYKDDTKNCATAMKFTYLEMLKNGVKPDKYYFRQERILLFNLSDHINKYALSMEPFCEAPVGKERHTLEDLEHSMTKVMQSQAFDLLDKIRSEKDPKVKDQLASQLKETLDLLPYPGAGKNPRTGKTLLVTLGESADLETLDLLISKGLSPLDLGYIDDTYTDGDIFDVTIRSGELAKLKFASRVYDQLQSDDSVVFNCQYLLKKIHPKDPETKAFRNDFKDKVDARENMIY